MANAKSATIVPTYKPTGDKFRSISSRKDECLEYLKLGWKIAPLNYRETNGDCSCPRGAGCRAVGKHPMRTKWHLPTKYIDTPKKLEQAFRQHYNSNWGIVTGKPSKIFVIDVDAKPTGKNKDGPTGLENFKKLTDEHGPLPVGPYQITGGGGLHYLFKYPVDGEIGNDSVGKLLGPGIDVRGDGGQIAVCPSMHSSGERYKWGIHPRDMAIPEAPQWLLELCTKKEEVVKPLTAEQIADMNAKFTQLREDCQGGSRYAEAALEAEINKLYAATEGTRNGTLNAAAYNLGRFIPTGMLLHSEVYHALLQAGQAIGLGIVESDHTIRSGIDAGQLKPKSLPERREWKPEFDVAGKTYRDLLVINNKSSESTEDDEVIEVFAMTPEEEEEFEVQFGTVYTDPVNYVRRKEKYTIHDFERESLLLPIKPIEADERPAPPTTMIDLRTPQMPWQRCSECHPDTHRPCKKCAERMNVQRPRPDKAPCTRGGRILLQSTDNSSYFSAFCPKCNNWNCPKCGYDKECDHLSHNMMIDDLLIDGVDHPMIQLPSKNVLIDKMTFAEVQPGCWKVTCHESIRREYANKLSKLGVYYITHFTDQLLKNYTFYCFLPIGFADGKLKYRSRRGRSPAVEVITFAKYKQEYRLQLASYGLTIRLKKTLWEACDQESDRGYTAVNYCSQLRMPKRMISTNKYKGLGRIKATEEEMLETARALGADPAMADVRKIDRSFRRGLTQYLLKFWHFEFPPGLSKTQVIGFIKKMTGKDKIDQMAQKLAEQRLEGSSYHTYQLVT